MPETSEDRRRSELADLSPGARARLTGELCSLCNQHHRQRNGVSQSCDGHRSKIRPYAPCQAAPLAGQGVCRMHGGATPVALAAAKKRVAWELAEGGVAKLLRECDLPEQHPIDGLLEVVRHSGAMMRLLGYIVSGMDSDGKVKFSENGLARYDGNLDQRESIYVQMYGQWADRYARACKLALDANIDERLVRNAEATTGVFLTAFEEALNEAQLEPDQARRFSVALANRLRQVAGPIDRSSLI